MDHIAIMKKEWGFVEKILSGQKTIESRWYKNRYKSWDAIGVGDTVYFKNSGAPVMAKADVKKVIQFENVNAWKVKEILSEYGKDIGIEVKDAAEFLQKFSGKKHCILIFLKNPKKVKPFLIDKKGFGTMASWVTVKNINHIKV